MPLGDYRTLLEERRGYAGDPGPIVDAQGARGGYALRLRALHRRAAARPGRCARRGRLRARGPPRAQRGGDRPPRRDCRPLVRGRWPQLRRRRAAGRALRRIGRIRHRATDVLRGDADRRASASRSRPQTGLGAGAGAGRGAVRRRRVPGRRPHRPRHDAPGCCWPPSARRSTSSPSSGCAATGVGSSRSWRWPAGWHVVGNAIGERIGFDLLRIGDFRLLAASVVAQLAMLAAVLLAALGPRRIELDEIGGRRRPRRLARAHDGPSRRHYARPGFAGHDTRPQRGRYAPRLSRQTL